MINTGFEIVDAIINNPVEAVIHFGLILFAYKFYFGKSYIARENRLGLKSWITFDVPFTIEYFFRHCFSNPHSYCNIDSEKLEQVLELIKLTPFMHNWALRDFLKAKLNLTNDQVSKTINALVDLGIVKFSDEHHIVMVK